MASLRLILHELPCEIILQQAQLSDVNFAKLLKVMWNYIVESGLHKFLLLFRGNYLSVSAF